MASDPANRIALVLSGGGAFGAYEVGVMKALAGGASPANGHQPVNADIFVGTSVGAFNAAMMAMNKGGVRESVANLETIWRNQVADKGDARGNGVYRIRGNPVNYFDPRVPGMPLEPIERFFDDTRALLTAAAPRVRNFFAFREGLIDRVENLVEVSAFLDTEPFCHLVESNLEPDVLRVSGKRLRVMATNWVTGEPEHFEFSKLNDSETWAAIRASAAIPGLFAPVKIRRHTYVDGGVVQNTPIRPAIEEGASEIHVVSLNPKMSHFPRHQLDNTLETFTRVYSAMLGTNIEEDIETARWVNEGLEAMEAMERQTEPAGDQMTKFAATAGFIYRRLKENGQLPRKLAIHRYFPNKCLGDLLAMLNFESAALNEMIEQGYSDARHHDCLANGCVGTSSPPHGRKFKAGA